MKSITLLISLFLFSFTFAQTSDDAFKKPLKDVLAEIETRFKVKIRYADELVKDK